MKAILLCAGSSNNTFPPDSKPKCLYHVGGETILEKLVANLWAAEVRDIRIVTGYRHSDIVEYLARNSMDLEVAYNPTWRDNAISSILTGVFNVEKDVLLICGDIILPSKKVIEEFKNAVFPITCVRSERPWGEYRGPSYTGYHQICLVRVARTSFDLFIPDTALTMARQWMQRQGKFNWHPGLGVVFGAYLNEMIYRAQPNLGEVWVDEPIPDIDQYWQTDEYKELMGR